MKIVSNSQTLLKGSLHPRGSGPHFEDCCLKEKQCAHLFANSSSYCFNPAVLAAKLRQGEMGRLTDHMYLFAKLAKALIIGNYD